MKIWWQSAFLNHSGGGEARWPESCWLDPPGLDFSPQKIGPLKKCRLFLQLSPPGSGCGGVGTLRVKKRLISMSGTAWRNTRDSHGAASRVGEGEVDGVHRRALAPRAGTSGNGTGGGRSGTPPYQTPPRNDFFVHFCPYFWNLPKKEYS